MTHYWRVENEVVSTGNANVWQCNNKSFSVLHPDPQEIALYHFLVPVVSLQNYLISFRSHNSFASLQVRDFSCSALKLWRIRLTFHWQHQCWERLLLKHVNLWSQDTPVQRCLSRLMLVVCPGWLVACNKLMLVTSGHQWKHGITWPLWLLLRCCCCCWSSSVYKSYLGLWQVGGGSSTVLVNNQRQRTMTCAVRHGHKFIHIIQIKEIDLDCLTLKINLFALEH